MAMLWAGARNKPSRSGSSQNVVDHSQDALESQEEKDKLPWVVPEEFALQLLFFRKVFLELREGMGLNGIGEEHGQSHPRESAVESGVPLVVFRRAMIRLLRVLGEAENFDVQKYDLNGDGTVGWWEFAAAWKEEKLCVRLSVPERIYLTMECPEMSRLGRFMSILVLWTIVFSAASFILSTLPSLQAQSCGRCEPEPFPVFQHIDAVCVAMFSVEYLIRLATAAVMRMELPMVNQESMIRMMCTDEVVKWPTWRSRIWDFMTAVPNIIDLMAILPTYLTWCLPDEKHGDPSGDNSNGTLVQVLKLVRLMRLVRAFRLARRLEAVMIITRSMRRSERALRVLILNIGITILVFGSVMFYAEQGEYDPQTKRYNRLGQWVLNEETQRWERDSEESPFKSIPHSCWFALVTATTLGYGDMVPRSLAGKVVTCSFMIWSLCVIALPVGVIGANFEQVWEEYDSELRAEKEMRHMEKQMERTMLGSIDPLSHSSRLAVEVWHNSRLYTRENDVFLGEAETTLKLLPRSSSKRQVELQLGGNEAKTLRRVTGRVYLSYTWKPSDPGPDSGVLLQGELQVTLIRAEDLPHVDWKENPSKPTPPGGIDYCDPYVVMTLFPTSPQDGGVLTPRVEHFPTIWDERVPTWNETRVINFCWKAEGVAARQLMNKMIVRSASAKILDLQVTADPKVDVALISLPRLMEDVRELQRAAPALEEDVRALRQVMHAILARLGAVASTGGAVGAGAAGEGPAPEAAGGANAACSLAEEEDLRQGHEEESDGQKREQESDAAASAATEGEEPATVVAPAAAKAAAAAQALPKTFSASGTTKSKGFMSVLPVTLSGRSSPVPSCGIAWSESHHVSMAAPYVSGAEDESNLVVRQSPWDSADDDTLLVEQESSWLAPCGGGKEESRVPFHDVVTPRDVNSELQFTVPGVIDTEYSRDQGCI